MKRSNLSWGRAGIAAIVGTISSAMIAAPALATPSSGFSTEQLAKGVYDAMQLTADKDGKWDLTLRTKDQSDVYVVRNTISPGGQSGWHTHPGPSLITVTAGEITVYEGDGLCQPKTYGVGDGALDLGSGHRHLIKNEGAANAVTVVVQMIPAGATRRIDADQPNNCAF
jgi:quercetin dioxygenase-like cupin family protein